MNKVITVHRTNIGTFNTRVAEVNKLLKRKNQPEIITRLISEKENVYEYELISAFDSSNIKGTECSFKGVVNLIDGDENSKVYSVEDSNIQNILKDCECDECHKKSAEINILCSQRLLKSKAEVTLSYLVPLVQNLISPSTLSHTLDSLKLSLNP